MVRRSGYNLCECDSLWRVDFGRELTAAAAASWIAFLLRPTGSCARAEEIDKKKKEKRWLRDPDSGL